MEKLLYSKLRDQIRTGDLLAWEITSFSEKSDLFLFLYQKIFKIKYSHVGIAVRIDDRVFVAEAVPPRVRLFPLSLKDDFYYIPCHLESNPKYLDYLLKDIGKPYSLFDLIKSIFNLSFNPENFYCSEYCADFYKAVGLLTDNEAGKFPHKLVEKISEVTREEPKYVTIDKGNFDGV